MLQKAEVRVAQKICSDCGAEFPALDLPSWTRCGSCAGKAADAIVEAWRVTERAGLAERASEVMRLAGCAPVDVASDRAAVPVTIKRLLPRSPIEALRDGRIPAIGLGLIGPQGIGKSGCLATLVRLYVERILAIDLEAQRVIPEGPEAFTWWRRPSVEWCTWPNAAEILKNISTARGGSADIERLVRRWEITGVLVLDDLGRERMRGSYSEDYSAGVLDRVIDTRSRFQRPILWTSNLSLPALTAHYGAALVSRLRQVGPPETLPATLPDLRVGAA